MISEKRFANEYNSFWSQLLPFSERYVRSMNHFQTSFGEEITFAGNGSVRAFVAEMAFCLASWRLQGRSVFNQSGLVQAYFASKDFFGEHGVNWRVFLNQTHLDSALKMAETSYEELKDLVIDKDKVEFRPSFNGCGLIATCEGDLRIGHSLIEFKSVSRGFRSTDYRQLITYVALNSAAQTQAIERVVLINARRSRCASKTAQI